MCGWGDNVLAHRDLANSGDQISILARRQNSAVPGLRALGELDFNHFEFILFMIITK